MPKGIPNLIKIGDIFENLTVISDGIPNISARGRKQGIKYLCKCACGNESYYTSSNLIRGISLFCKKCSNKRRIVYYPSVGTKFGNLEVINDKELYTTNLKTNRRKYECKCSCGNIKYYSITLLVTKRVTCCPTCAFKSRPQSEQRYSNLERLFNLSVVKRCETAIKKGRNIKNELTLEEFANIICKDCYYCGALPTVKMYASNDKKQPIIANGIDRINSSKGYSIENCVPCCTHCNIMKSNLTIEEFKKKIKTLYEKWIKQDDIPKEN